MLHNHLSQREDLFMNELSHGSSFKLQALYYKTHEFQFMSKYTIQNIFLHTLLMESIDEFFTELPRPSSKFCEAFNILWSAEKVAVFPSHLIRP